MHLVPAVLLAVILLAAPLRAEPPAYRLGPGDAVRLTVFGEEDLSGAFTVDGSGRVALPLIGELRLGGLSVPEAEQAVAARLADGYLKGRASPWRSPTTGRSTFSARCAIPAPIPTPPA